MGLAGFGKIYIMGLVMEILDMNKGIADKVWKGIKLDIEKGLAVSICDKKYRAADIEINGKYVVYMDYKNMKMIIIK